MNASQILTKTITLVTPQMHAARRKTLVQSISSLLAGANATVTSIGRGIHSNTSDKHNIKRADRLLSNPHLLAEIPSIYLACTRLFTSLTTQPIIHVDWSDLDEYKRHYLLRASMAFEGRSITLYEKVHCIKTKEKPTTHEAFLEQLKWILPQGAKPIIVTDAGFKGPWFKQLRKLGWHYVGRARKPNFYHAGDENWQCISTLYSQATQTPRCFDGQLCKYKPMDTLFVLYKQAAKGRHKVNRSGQRCHSKHSNANASMNTDPWLLVTSLPQTHHVAKKVVRIYQTRMQIEESFRDMKSHRFGLGFDVNLSKYKNRISILVLLTTLAHITSLLLGWAVVTSKRHYQYQANTTRKRRVLSFQFVGLRAFIDRHMRLTMSQWRHAIEQLKLKIQEVNYEVI